MGKHLAPQRPVVFLPAADVQPVVDALTIKDSGHTLVRFQANIPLGGTQHDVHAPEGRIIGVDHKIYWVVEVDIIVVVAVQEGLNIKGTAHAEQVTHLTGVTERKVSRVVTAEARSSHCHFVVVRLRL